jgi:GDP-L-fucose synthase
MNIVVTGGYGFLGKAVMDILSKNDQYSVYTFHSKDFDLTKNNDVKKMYKFYKPDIVVHLAAEVGGIGANMANPGRFFYSNMSMGLNLIECGRLNNLKKFVFVSTVCSYPKYTPAPFKECDIWNGYPEETNAPYGIAKKSIATMLQAYKHQYGLNGCVLVPTNLYGPFDNFDPYSSHVIPALIHKVFMAKKNNAKFIECWGDGDATREFLYVKDAALGIVQGMMVIDDPDPINLGSGVEITIKDLVTKIMYFMDYKGDIVWNCSKPNGQPRRLLDVSKANRVLGWKANMDFDNGLQNTIDYYIKYIGDKNE